MMGGRRVSFRIRIWKRGLYKMTLSTLHWVTVFYASWVRYDCLWKLPSNVYRDKSWIGTIGV